MRLDAARWRAALAALLLGAGMAAGCASAGGGLAVAVPDGLTVEEIHVLVTAIAGRIDLLETRTGTWERGESFSAWRAEIGPAGPEFIEERRGLGEAGMSLVRYYFVSGRLIQYQEEGERLAPSPGGMAARRPFDRTILFCTSGRVVSSGGHLDGRDAPPDEAEIAAARAQAAALYERAPSGHLVHPARAPGTPPPPDLMHPHDNGPRP
jgi:hypothetical protein